MESRTKAARRTLRVEPSRLLVPAVGLALLLLAGCDDDSVPSQPATTSIDDELRQSLTMRGVVPIGPMPEQDPALVELGRALFFDPVLSGNRDVSCATCHHPAAALGDGRSLPVGTGGSGVGPERTRGQGREFVPRSSPSLLNSGVGMPYLFWDGRLSGQGSAHLAEEGEISLPSGLSPLAAQAVLPLLNRREMRGEPGDTDVFGEPNELAGFDDEQHLEIWQAVMDRLEAIPGYVDRFGAAFPGVFPSRFRIEHVARALAAFQRESFTKTRSPFDRYLDRDDAALTREEKRGALLFLGKAGCANCHGGPFLGGQGFANVGVPQIGPGIGAEAPLDAGRGTLIGNEFYRFAFRIGMLRNIELTAPYMHDGAFATLEDVVRHYDDVRTSLRAYDASVLDPDVRDLYHGDEATLEAVLSTLDPRVQTPLELTEAEIDELVAFLKSLTDPAAEDLGSTIPASVPSGLPVE